jgi:adenine-specific DNA methylase
MAELRFARYRNGFRLTHYLFRFPAKFHPPAVRCLIDRYSKRGDTLLDPFCGSGTMLLEALVAGRSAIGVDVDPVAAFISRVKCRPISAKQLEREFHKLQKAMAEIRRTSREYDRLMHEDLAPSSISRFRDRYRIPDIPNIEHWFRIYVILDLARLRLLILRGSYGPRIRDFFLACFASIIRNASNADPVPVSGLEVTSHMRALDAKGRRIDPFELFERRVRREIKGMGELSERAEAVSIGVRRADATALSRIITARSIDLAITSPPYNTAVDYYRRHTLEMYWLGFVSSHEERTTLAQKYLGRAHIRTSNKRVKASFSSPYIRRLITHAGAISASRERAVCHYCASMRRTLDHLGRVLRPSGLAVFVVGNSKWNGQRVRATKVLEELAEQHFEVVETLSYASRNRYMSYARHNGADVNREYVLVLKKKPSRKPGKQKIHRSHGESISGKSSKTRLFIST